MGNGRPFPGVGDRSSQFDPPEPTRYNRRIGAPQINITPREDNVKKLLSILMALALLGTATSAFAMIDWAGNAFPNAGNDTVPTDDQFVVAEVFKLDVTEATGQGAGISAMIYYQTDLMGAQASVAMSYNVDKGNNDEYLGFIPQADLLGASFVDVTVIFEDTTDGTSFEITGDQAGNPPPLRYTIVDVLPNDVSVTFTMCMSGTPTAGVPCVIGSAAEIGSWGTGVNMNNAGGELWTVDVDFLAGSNPSFEYKYKKDECVDWESVDNRFVTLPTDGTTSVVLDTDSWNNAPIGCDLGNVLLEDKTVCYQLCMMDVENVGGVCVIGNGALLTVWTTGVSMEQLGGDLWQACVVYPAGMAIPFNQEFKYKKDNCETWESVPNRLLVIDNSIPIEQAVTFTWDDGLGICTPVPTDAHSWGSLKSKY